MLVWAAHHCHSPQIPRGPRREPRSCTVTDWGGTGARARASSPWPPRAGRKCCSSLLPCAGTGLLTTHLECEEAVSQAFPYVLTSTLSGGDVFSSRLVVTDEVVISVLPALCHWESQPVEAQPTPVLWDSALSLAESTPASRSAWLTDTCRWLLSWARGTPRTKQTLPPSEPGGRWRL